MNKVTWLFSWILLWPSCLAPAIMATEAGQDEEPVAGTSLSQPKESVDTHLTMAEQMHQMQQMMGAIINKFQKWEAEHDQTVAAESENESVGDSPARGGLNKALELTVNSARGEKSHSGEVDTDTNSEFCVAIPQTKESGLKVDMLTLLAANLEQERPVGPTVNEKLAEISRSRFRQKMPESKLKSKMDKYPVPENCPDVSPPTLNSELTDKGYVDRTTKKSDGRLVNVQMMLSAATSCLVMVPSWICNWPRRSNQPWHSTRSGRRPRGYLVLQNGRWPEQTRRSRLWEMRLLFLEWHNRKSVSAEFFWFSQRFRKILFPFVKTKISL